MLPSRDLLFASISFVTMFFNPWIHQDSIFNISVGKKETLNSLFQSTIKLNSAYLCHIVVKTILRILLLWSSPDLRIIASKFLGDFSKTPQTRTILLLQGRGNWSTENSKPPDFLKGFPKPQKLIRVISEVPTHLIQFSARRYSFCFDIIKKYELFYFILIRSHHEKQLQMCCFLLDKT